MLNTNNGIQLGFILPSVCLGSFSNKEENMNIVEKRLNELKPYENNPRINDGAVKFVKNSIEEFGFKVPIVIDKNGVIVAGHTRYKASQELGLETVPCVVADDLTDEQVKAFRIADNKTAEKASWDLDALKTEMEELEEIDGIDMRDFGFGDFEISALTEDMEAEGYDNELMDAFSEHSEDMLKKQRVIITYETEEEQLFLEKLLQVTELKVCYDIKELMHE